MSECHVVSCSYTHVCVTRNSLLKTTNVYIRGISKIFPESFYFWEIQNNTTFKQCFLENSPIVQLHTSFSDYKGAENFPGTHLHILNVSAASQKRSPFNADFRRENM